MPSLTFIMPHWLYWAGLVVFPLVALYLVRRQLAKPLPPGPSLFIAYLFWLTAGFLGIHRFYVRSAYGFVFIPVFLFILYCNAEVREVRDDTSRTFAALDSAQHTATIAKPDATSATPEVTAAYERAQADVPADVAEERRSDAEVEHEQRVLAGDAGDRIDGAASDERQEEHRADETRRSREREQVVATEERLQQHVVEREGDRCDEDDQRALRVREGEVSAGAEQDDDGDARERDRQPEGAAQVPALEAEAGREQQRQRGGEGDDERGRPGRRVLRAHVQEDVVTDDDAEADRAEPERVAPGQAGEPADPPEEISKAGGGDEIAQDGDVLRHEAVVEQRLDHRERARPDDHDREQGRVGRRRSPLDRYDGVHPRS